LGVRNCPCAELLVGIAPGDAIRAFRNDEPVVGYLAGAVTPNVIQVENLGELINLCCSRLSQVTRLNVVPLAYVSIQSSNDVSVINTNTNTVIDTIGVGNSPGGVAFTRDARKAYVSNNGSDSVSVIDTLNGVVVKEIPVGNGPD
jgi:YVTN family beta-propeller protein